MTECNQEVFSFASHFSRRVEASFTAGQVSTDGGALLLRQADLKIGLLKRVASCFTDRRSPLLVSHQLGEMLWQRIYGLALGYEDLCDHEQLRHDPLMAVLSGRRKLEDPLAGKPGSPRTGLRPWGGSRGPHGQVFVRGWKSTLNRLELPGGSQRYHKIDFAPENRRPGTHQRPARVAGAQFHLSVEADLRSGLLGAAMLTVSTATQQLFHTNPRIGLAELCLKSNLDLR